MRTRVAFPILLLLTSGFLSGCETTSERPGVREARACQRALENNPARLEGFVIKACTNTGVWVVERVDPVMGTRLAEYDFLNGDYIGPETGFSPVAVDSLGDDLIRSYRALRISLNQSLKQTL